MKTKWMKIKKKKMEMKMYDKKQFSSFSRNN